MIDTIFYSIELALILHIAIGFIAKYPAWVANGGTFHPATPQAAAAPAEVQKPEPLYPYKDELGRWTMPAMAATMTAPVAVARVEVEPVGDDLAALPAHSAERGHLMLSRIKYGK